MARLSCSSALFALFSGVLEMIAMNLDAQATTASVENEFPHWKVWTGTDQLLHACVPWDTNMYVTAETLDGLRDGIIGYLRLRELALDQLRKTGTVSPPVFLGERHDFQVQEARKALAENCSDIDKLRKHVRLLIQLTELESARCRLG
jgi:hypothetical protein